MEVINLGADEHVGYLLGAGLRLARGLHGMSFLQCRLEPSHCNSYQLVSKMKNSDSFRSFKQRLCPISHESLAAAITQNVIFVCARINGLRAAYKWANSNSEKAYSLLQGELDEKLRDCLPNSQNPQNPRTTGYFKGRDKQTTLST